MMILSIFIFFDTSKRYWGKFLIKKYPGGNIPLGNSPVGIWPGEIHQGIIIIQKKKIANVFLMQFSCIWTFANFPTNFMFSKKILQKIFNFNPNCPVPGIFYFNSLVPHPNFINFGDFFYNLSEIHILDCFFYNSNFSALFLEQVL